MPFDNGLIGRIYVEKGRVNLRRLQRALDAFVETLPVSVGEIIDTDNEECRQIMATAERIVSENIVGNSATAGPTEIEVVIERKKKGGRPRVDKPDGVKRAEAIERARASKDRREAAGKVEVRYYVSPETKKRADDLIERRRLSGMGALIEELVNDATKGNKS